VIGQSPYKALFGSDPKVGLSSSSVPRDLLPDIQTEEDLQAIFEANSGSTDNTDTDAAISQTEQYHFQKVPSYEDLCKKVS
jgi:hypothetical protein